VAEATFDENLANARVAEQDVRTAQLNAHIAELEVKQSEAVVALRVLRSSIDGIVTDVLLHPGEYRNDQSPILTLAQIDPLRVAPCRHAERSDRRLRKALRAVALTAHSALGNEGLWLISADLRSKPLNRREP
jgi:multidrug efflux pump subunit AcrA (membrane-fusion protein)